MEQPLKQRLIGAVILISLAVIFIPMVIGQKPTALEVISIEIPEPPKDLNSKIVALPKQSKEVFAEISISKDTGVVVTKAVIPSPPKVEVVEIIKGWVIQVGSFSDEKNANGLSDKLKKAGFTSFVQKSVGKKSALYRVRVGPELKKDKAESIKDKLQKQLKLTNAIVVKYP